ncbi:MAG: hypothetical protein U0350_40060 [Caldilineaceae bacterium]
MDDFLQLVRLILVGVLILTLVKLTYVTADYMDREAAQRAQAAIDAATPTPSVCHRYYNKRQAGKPFTFVQDCEVR